MRPYGFAKISMLCLPLLPATMVLLAKAQSIQPVIVEYKNKASGMFSVTDNTAEPMIVVFEPKSFSIAPNGRGTFRPLDPAIHLQLSAKSIRLQPKQTYYVFYKADADAFPAWFTIYSTFSAARPGGTVSVRIQLPHTVYLYQNAPIQQDDVHILNTTYSPSTHKLICDLQNAGKSLARVQEVRTMGPHTEPVVLAGFPLLPGAMRHIEVDWTGKEPPKSFNMIFEHFTLKPPVFVKTDPDPQPPAAAPSTVPAAVAEFGAPIPPLPSRD